MGISVTGSDVLRLLDIALWVIDGLESAGVNYQEVIGAQKLAKLQFERGERESAELNASERQFFIDQAQAAVDAAK